jgi:bla regulator protein BlaR1
MMNHLVQSTVFAALMGLLTLLLRNNRAATRYWVWLAASLKFLIPFSLFVEIGHRLTWTTAPLITQPQLSFVMEQVIAPAYLATSAAPVIAPAGSSSVLPAIWVFGIVAVVMFWLMRWQRVARVLRGAVMVREGRAFARLRRLDPRTKLVSFEGSIEPGVFGILRPVLYLPDGIAEHLDDAQLDAIFLHELTHIRRRDNLTASLHMLVEAVFWFHPLVWWMGARLVEERERACDEEVVRLGSDPEVYAESILKICRRYLESPLACVSGVTGSDLRKRIEAIMASRVIFRLNFAKKSALAVAAGVALALPILIGIVNVPGIRAQVKGPTPKFEAASIRLSRECIGTEQKLTGPLPGGPLPKSAPPPPRPPAGAVSITTFGRLDECHTLADLIHMAYIMYAGGTFHGVWGPQFDAGPPLEGGPAWVRSDIYRVIGTAGAAQSRGVMSGPMLQALLEDRFKLKVHRVTREVPVYTLTVAKGGSKMVSSTSSCVTTGPHEPGTPFAPPAPDQRYCRDMIGGRRGMNTGVNATSKTLDQVCELLSHLLDRPVVNKTGIDGRYDFHLEFAIDEATPKFLPGGPMSQIPGPTSDDPAGPSVFTVLQTQLGLKLEAAKGPGDFLVIDRVERPTGN